VQEREVPEPAGSDVPSFRTSSFSGGSACIEVGRRRDGQVVVRDSKDPRRRAVLTFDRNSWASFLESVKNGDFDDLGADG
jgi:hypothetical protein